MKKARAHKPAVTIRPLSQRELARVDGAGGQGVETLRRGGGGVETLNHQVVSP
jgi:hypothetical protein